MAWFVISIVLALISLAWFAFASKTRVPDGYESDGYTKKYIEVSLKKFGFLGVVLAAFALLFSCFAMVGAKNVGVPTVFGKTTGDTYGAGLNFKAPWVEVTDIDATVQPEEYRGEDCIYVQIADAGSACISLAYRWRIVPNGADTVYSDYRNAEDEDGGITEAVRKALVSTNIKAAINEVFGTYDPLADIDLSDDMTAEELANIKVQLPDLKTFNAAIKLNVEEKIKDLGDLIEIQSVTVSFVKLPEKTQSRINEFNAKVMDVKLALQDVAIKQAQAAANLELADSLKDPNVLVSKCLDGMISGDLNAPAGFQCWSGSAGAVVVPATK